MLLTPFLELAAPWVDDFMEIALSFLLRGPGRELLDWQEPSVAAYLFSSKPPSLAVDRMLRCWPLPPLDVCYLLEALGG